MEAPSLSFLNQLGYTSLRRLAKASDTYLCREWATERLVVAKYWPTEMEECAQRETRALIELDGESFLPRLGSIFKTGQGFWQTRTYLPGTSLQEFGVTAKAPEKAQVFVATVQAVRKLHERGWVHRDLTPTNILVSGPQIFLIDFDLTEKISDQNVSSFRPKGTIGFSLAHRMQDLGSQDWQAMEKIRLFLGLDEQIWQRLEARPKERKSWLSELF
jgi:serine/threonine protein kinase